MTFGCFTPIFGKPKFLLYKKAPKQEVMVSVVFSLTCSLLLTVSL